MTMGEGRRRSYNDFSLRMSNSLSKRQVYCVVENLSRVFLSEQPLILLCRDDNGAWRGRRMRSSSRPLWFYLAPSPPRPAQHDGENFLTPSPPLEAPRNHAPPHKVLLFVNLPYNQYNFFLMKPISLIKIYLKLQLNLTRQSPKKKTHSITHNKIKVENHIG